MSPFLKLDPRLAGAASVVALLAGVWFYALLMVAAEPKEAVAGAPKAERDLAQAEAVLSARSTAPIFPPGTVCHLPADTAAQALRQRIQTAAQMTGANLTSTSVQASLPSAATGWLTPINLKLEANGSYGAALAFAGAMAKAQPMLFIESAELRSKGSAAAITIDGRIYCSTYALP